MQRPSCVAPKLQQTSRRPHSPSVWQLSDADPEPKSNREVVRQVPSEPKHCPFVQAPEPTQVPWIGPAKPLSMQQTESPPAPQSLFDAHDELPDPETLTILDDPSLSLNSTTDQDSEIVVVVSAEGCTAGTPVAQPAPRCPHLPGCVSCALFGRRVGLPPFVGAEDCGRSSLSPSAPPPATGGLASGGIAAGGTEVRVGGESEVGGAVTDGCGRAVVRETNELLVFGVVRVREVVTPVGCVDAVAVLLRDVVLLECDGEGAGLGVDEMGCPLVAECGFTDVTGGLGDADLPGIDGRVAEGLSFCEVFAGGLPALGGAAEGAPPD